LTSSFEENPLTEGHKILSLKTTVLRAAHNKDFVILACTVLIQITSVTMDRQTDGRTPRRWLRRAKHSAIARKNCSIFSLSVITKMCFVKRGNSGIDVSLLLPAAFS